MAKFASVAGALADVSGCFFYGYVKQIIVQSQCQQDEAAPGHSTVRKYMENVLDYWM